MGGNETLFVLHLLTTYLKVHRDRRPSPFLLIVGGQELDLSADLRLFHPSHAFDPTHTHTKRHTQLC